MNHLGEPPFLQKLVEYPNKTALDAIKAREIEEQKAQKHYKKMVDRKFIQSNKFIHMKTEKKISIFFFSTSFTLDSVFGKKASLDV